MRKTSATTRCANFSGSCCATFAGHVFVIWDNASIHKGERIREICRRFPRLHLELLPPYAPQLNPDEAVWAYAKGRLANGCPDDIAVMHRHLRRTLRDIKRSQRCLRRCIHQSELPPFCTDYCILYTEINNISKKPVDVTVEPMSGAGIAESSDTDTVPPGVSFGYPGDCSPGRAGGIAECEPLKAA